MSNKGFIMIESIISSVILIVLLINFYVFSSRVITIMNSSSNYNNVEDTYKISNIRTFIYNNSDLKQLNNELFTKLDTTACISIKNLKFDKDDITNTYTELINEMNVENIYLCNFEKNININNKQFNKYFEYIKKKYSDKYRLVYYNKNNDCFSSIKMWRVKNG